MAQINKIAGTAYLKVDGTQYSLRGSVTANLKPSTREGIAGQDGVHGYKEMPMVPFIAVDISTTPELDLNALAKLDDITVQLECANGKSGLLRNAWADLGDVNPEEGSLSVRFEGKSGEWL